jgi:redox-regulated HSP33 family molecular chaperone
MEPLVIRDGNFYRGSDLIKPEIGNLEQIKVLREFEKQGDLFKTGLVVDPDFETVTTGSVSFKCICGKNVYKEMECADEEIDDFIDEVVKCRHCDRKYKFDDNEDGDLVVKLTK